MHLKLLEKEQFRKKQRQLTGVLIGNKTDKITKALTSSPQNSSETVESETESTGLDREIPKERYMSPEKREQIINDLILRYNNITMEYQKIINLLDNTPNQPSKFKTKNSVEINDGSRI